MKVAVSSDDKVTIRKGHFGEGKYFLVFTTQGTNILAEEVRENRTAETGEHEARAPQVMQLLPDVKVLIGRSMGRHSVSKIVAKGKLPLLTQIESAQEAVQAFLNGEREKFWGWDEEKEKFVRLEADSDEKRGSAK